MTISGSSAGGGTVHNLMVAPKARGLFRRAIPMSIGGAGGRPLEVAADTARRYLTHLGVAPGDEEALPRPKPGPGYEIAPLFEGATRPLAEIKRAYVASLEAAGRPAEDGDVFSAAARLRGGSLRWAHPLTHVRSLKPVKLDRH